MKTNDLTYKKLKKKIIFQDKSFLSYSSKNNKASQSYKCSNILKKKEKEQTNDNERRTNYYKFINRMTEPDDFDNILKTSKKSNRIINHKINLKYNIETILKENHLKNNKINKQNFKNFKTNSNIISNKYSKEKAISGMGLECLLRNNNNSIIKKKIDTNTLEKDLKNYYTNNELVNKKADRKKIDVKKNTKEGKKKILTKKKNTCLSIANNDVIEFRYPLRKKILILDLDETLIHTSFTEIKDFDFKFYGNADNKKNLKDIMYVKIRPGTKELINQLPFYYNIYIYSASTKYYCESITKIIDKHKKIKKIYCRDDCLVETNQEDINQYIKDLSKISKDEKQIVMIDDNNLCFSLNKDNGILIKPWYGEKGDNELFKLIPVLKNLSYFNDVRNEIIKFIKDNKNTIDWDKSHVWLKDKCIFNEFLQEMDISLTESSIYKSTSSVHKINESKNERPKRLTNSQFLLMIKNDDECNSQMSNDEGVELFSKNDVENFFFKNKKSVCSRKSTINPTIQAIQKNSTNSGDQDEKSEKTIYNNSFDS